MKWKVISASVRGSAHQRTGLPNQDAVDHAVAPRNTAGPTVLAVSDGHGGDRHFRSQVGSTLAVHVTVKVVSEYLARTAVPDGAGLTELGRKIVDAWQAAVASDLANNPFTEMELTGLVTAQGQTSKESVEAHPELAYGATLLVTAATDESVIFLQLGDGDILAVAADGATTRPLTADDRLVGNQTTSLCQPDAWREFRTGERTAAEGLPVLVLLSTDGYLNSFRSQEDFLQIGSDYLQILQDQGSETLADELPKILTEATQQGSGDDITLGMLHVEVLPAAKAVLAGVGKPAVSKSVMIRELTEERAAQQRKMTELESNFAGVRKHVLQLRLLVGAVILIATAAFTQQYWRPLLTHKTPNNPMPSIGTGSPERRPAKGGSEPGDAGPIENPAATPAAGGASPAPAAETGVADGNWFLVEASGKEIALSSGQTISSTELVPKEAEHAYARVKKQDNVLVLTNLSSDVWTVTLPETHKTSHYAKNDLVTLREGIKISFHKGASATVTFRKS